MSQMLGRSVKKSVSASLEARVLASLFDIGMDWSEITYHTGIYPADINVPNGRIDAQKHYRLLKLHYKKTGGMDWFLNQHNYENALFINRENVYNALAQDAHSLTTLCLNCLTLGDALDYYSRYRAIVGNVDNLQIETGQDQVVVRFTSEFPEFEYHVVAMINFIFVISIIEFYCGKKNKINAALKSEQNKLLTYIYDYWGCSVEWGKEANQIFFDAALLKNTNPTYNPILHALVLKKVDDEYSAIYDVSEFSHVVERTIYDAICEKRAEYNEHEVMLSICTRYNITRSTVYRKLAVEDTSFRQLESQVKLSESIKMLKNTMFSIGEISNNLGFSSQSAFNRFFSEKMKTTPLKYRKS